jgi:hypothetical protein
MTGIFLYFRKQVLHQQVVSCSVIFLLRLKEVPGLFGWIFLIGLDLPSPHESITVGIGFDPA